MNIDYEKDISFSLVDKSCHRGSLVTFTPQGVAHTVHGQEYWLTDYDEKKYRKTLSLRNRNGLSHKENFANERKIRIYPGIPMMFLKHIPYDPAHDSLGKKENPDNGLAKNELVVLGRILYNVSGEFSQGMQVIIDNIVITLAFTITKDSQLPFIVPLKQFLKCE